jgi:isopentenyl-diphosphate delta-isomerase
MASKDRKKDHISMALESQTAMSQIDDRFYYEPLLTTFPNEKAEINGYLAGIKYNAPLWVSSMTGGTSQAFHINQNLARAAGDFGFGMGLGSCRKLLDSNEFFEDFDIRKWMPDQALFANLGIAQIIDLLKNKRTNKIIDLLDKLSADGLIIHVNPIQEWLQPEGDRIESLSPLQAIEGILDLHEIKIIVKEVGQGMGPESLKSLLKLPIAAFEFGAFGGTNFARLESLRRESGKEIDPICFVGHTPKEMIKFINDIGEESEIKCRDFIISGGVKNYLDGFYYNHLLKFNSVYGQASSLLQYAIGDYDLLAQYIQDQLEGYKFALRYLNIK